MSSLAKDSVVAAGKLRVLRKIGEGGMGAVYEVEHLLTGHRRALKVLLPEFGEHEEVIERFRMEATVAARLQTKAVVQTFDAGLLEDGSPYLLMEMLDGKPLDELMDPLLEISQLAAIMAQACEALHEAHQAGVVHRDIKPDNLFLCADGVKVLDFGISKFLGQEAETKTVDGMALGTPHYMSPEQARGQNDLVDHRTDIYSLGVVLFECLTGVKPFDGTFPAIIIAINTGTRERVCELRSDVSSTWDEVIDRALADNRDDRFASMLELAQAIQDAAQSTPELPQLPRTSHRGWLGGGALALTLLAGGLWLSGDEDETEPSNAPPALVEVTPEPTAPEENVAAPELPIGVMAPVPLEAPVEVVARPRPTSQMTVAGATRSNAPTPAEPVGTPIDPPIQAPVTPQRDEPTEPSEPTEPPIVPRAVGELGELDRDNPYGD